MTNEQTQIPQNYAKQVEWIYGNYEDANVTLADGFQKDSIQNSVGARKSNKWKNWICNISVKVTKKGTFLIVEDSGTEGLTGPNLSSKEIQQRIDAGEILDSSMRLARFSSMNNSGGNLTGGGLYGVGKIIYSVASKDFDYYFDSLREDGLYVANRNEKGSVYKNAFEGETAKKFILNGTGLPEKCTVGTRVIICDPKKEIIDAINKGDLASYIQETWWIILNRMDSSSGIYVNGVRVKAPVQPKYTYKYDLPNEVNYNKGYRIKHFGIYISETGENPWTGISYYRKGMKIGEVELKDIKIPQTIKDKFWGYIEVDEPWENELAKIENRIHYGVSKGKKLSNSYQYLKSYVSAQFRRLLITWGYIKDEENEDQKLRSELQKIAEDLQNLFDSLGFEDLGKGPEKSDFDIRWKNIIFPIPGSETVGLGDSIKFSFRIVNNFLTVRNFDYSIIIITPEDHQLQSVIEEGECTIEPNDTFTKDFSFVVSIKNAVRFKENRIVLKVKVKNSLKQKVKELPFFFDISKQNRSRRQVLLSLNYCDFPHKESRRVNFGEQLKCIRYRIENKRNDTLPYRLNVSVHNMADGSATKIMDICSINGNLNPYEEVIVDKIPDITFDENVYSNYLEKGELELRARIIATDNSGEFEKGDKIAVYKYRIFLNCDEKNGKEDAFKTKTVFAPNDYRRSYCEVDGNERTICLNCSHPAYLFYEDNDVYQHTYIREQMLTQYVLLYLDEGKYNMFCKDGENFDDFDSVTAAKHIVDKIENVYCRSLAS